MVHPVVEEWMTNKIIATKGAAGHLVSVSDRNGLQRGDVIANSHVVAPVLFHMGVKHSVESLTDLVEEFLYQMRPRGKPAFPRSLNAYRII